ncbi:substrate-binding domain-containing protein, partial [Vibrio sp. D173a]|uniref:substrate-binding domain-containing protein n=1 Tax=Vibrio sp. D173a TaxID=2836349 RepID=UPI002553E6E2
MKIKALIATTTVALTMATGGVANAASRDYISIVGSSTVFPFATVVAERFGRTSSYPVPKIESTGSGGGLKLFCAGIGENTPDITNASRKIKSSEVELCAKNGVNDIVEIKIGFDGIVLANSKKAEQFELSLQDVYKGVAKMVPDANGNLVENPYKTWKEVNPALPNIKIEVLGPPPTSGTRDAFAELALEGGCKTFPEIKAIKKTDKKKYKAVCHSVREDGGY